MRGARSLAGGIVITLSCLVTTDSLALPTDQDNFTSFESLFTMQGVPFSLGSTPDVTFSGDAFSGSIGNAALYHNDGFFSWMVDGGGAGVIDFEVNAAVVEFFAKANPGLSPGETTVITALDDLNQQLDSVTVTPGEDWRLVSFVGDIDHVEVVNNALSTGPAAYNGIDDFGYTPVPEPQDALWVALIALAILSRKTAPPGAARRGA